MTIIGRYASKYYFLSHNQRNGWHMNFCAITIVESKISTSNTQSVWLRRCVLGKINPFNYGTLDWHLLLRDGDYGIMI